MFFFFEKCIMSGVQLNIYPSINKCFLVAKFISTELCTSMFIELFINNIPLNKHLISKYKWLS